MIFFSMIKRSIDISVLTIALVFIIAAGVVGFCIKPHEIKPVSEVRTSSNRAAQFFVANNPWYTFSHDAQRTSTSTDGVITTPTEQWTRVMGTNSLWGGAGWVIGDDINLWTGYSDWSPTQNGTGTWYAINKYDINGNLLWADRRLGYNHTEWYGISKIGNYIVHCDDGIERVSDDGTFQSVGWRDRFAEVCPDPNGLQYYFANAYTTEINTSLQLTGVTIERYIPLWSANYTWRLWQQDKLINTGAGSDRNRSSLAFDNSKLYYAPKYYSSGTFISAYSGVYAINPVDGSTLWFKQTVPDGRISCGNSLIYGIENGTTLTARNQSDGAVAWTRTITGLNRAIDGDNYTNYGQPPVLANNLCIIPTTTGVYAYNWSTGAPVWSTTIQNIFDSLDSRNYNRNSYMAAAAGSNTLVVTARDSIRILDLNDGSIDYAYRPPSIVYRPVNPIIIGSRLYVTDGLSDNISDPNWNYSYFHLVCLQSGGSPPPPDVTPPTLNSNLSFTGVTTSSITANWTAATDNVSIAYYNFYYRQQGASTWIPATTTSTSYTLNNLLSGTTYEFYYNAVDPSGNISSNSATGTQATSTPPPPDTNPTTQLTGSVVYTSSTGQYTTHSLSWQPVTPGVTVILQYKSRAFAYRTVPGYVDNGLTSFSYVQPDTKNTYTYRILMNGSFSSNEVQLRSRKR